MFTLGLLIGSLIGLVTAILLIVLFVLYAGKDESWYHLIDALRNKNVYSEFESILNNHGIQSLSSEDLKILNPTKDKE